MTLAITWTKFSEGSGGGKEGGEEGGGEGVVALLNDDLWFWIKEKVVTGVWVRS